MSNTTTNGTNNLATLTDAEIESQILMCRCELTLEPYIQSGGGLFKNHDYWRTHWCGSAAVNAIHNELAKLLAEQARRAGA